MLDVWSRRRLLTDMSQWIVLTLSTSRDSMTITSSVIGASSFQVLCLDDGEDTVLSWSPTFISGTRLLNDTNFITNDFEH